MHKILSILSLTIASAFVLAGCSTGAVGEDQKNIAVEKPSSPSAGLKPSERDVDSKNSDNVNKSKEKDSPTKSEPTSSVVEMEPIPESESTGDLVNTDDSPTELYIVAPGMKVAVSEMGIARSEGYRNLELDLNLAGQVKEALRDSPLMEMKLLPEADRSCDSTKDDFGVIIPAWDGADSKKVYQLCDYAEGTEDPVLLVANQILKEVYTAR